MGIQIKGSNDTISAADGTMTLEGQTLAFTNENITGISTMATGHITGTATIDDDLKVGISTLFVDKSAGRVGIGTDNPQVRLTVSSDSPAVMDVHHVDGGTNDEARIILGALALNPPSNRGAGIAAVNNGAGHDLIIKCSASHAVGPTEKVRVTSSGTVGINTTVPGRQLEVYHDTQGTIAIKSGGAGQSSLWLTDTGDSNIGGVYYHHTTNKLGIRVNDSERLCINSTGDVNITGLTTATGFYPSSAQTGRRNMFINGNMSIAQRSTSSSTGGYYTLDRFYTHWSGGAGTISQETLSPGDELEGSSHYLRMTVTTASDYTVMRCPLEDVRRFSGDITVSFWAKYVTNAPNGGLACWFQTNYGSGGTANGTTAQQVFNGSGLPSLTTSWVKYSVTFSDFPALSGKTIGAGNYAEFLFGQGATAGSTAFTLDITNIQVEKGKSASAFEQIGHQENLAQCQRYYYKESIANNDFYSGMGMADVDGNSVILNLPFPVTMRQEPSLDTTGAATDYMIRRSTTAQCTSVPTIGGASTKHMAAVVFTKSSHGFGDGSAVRCGAWGNSYLGFNAELSI